MLRDVVEVRVLDGYRVFLRFEDSIQGELDLEPLLSPFDGVFELLAVNLTSLRRGAVDAAAPHTSTSTAVFIPTSQFSQIVAR